MTAMKPMPLIITNPMNSGRSFRMMVLARGPDGKFVHTGAEEEVPLGDGLTTVVQLEPGARLIVREEHEPAMGHEMTAHPAMTGKPPGQPVAADIAARNAALQEAATRNEAGMAQSWRSEAGANDY